MNTFLILATDSDKAAGIFFGLGAFGLALALVAFLFWIWMLIDALTNASLDPTMKLVWGAVVFFLPVLGGLAYLLVGRKPRAV
jgi:hypothetical protein